MLYHNVMWKFCDAEGKTLDENIEIVRAGLTALPEKISQIKSLTFIKNEVAVSYTHLTLPTNSLV